MLLRRILIPAIVGISLPFLFVSVVSAAVKHTVSGGETLSFIALIYEKSVSEIAEHNGLLNPDLIHPGQELDIPGSGGTGGASTESSYIVQPGDTLGAIAWERDVTTSALQAANGIGDADFIFPGQVLTIPSAVTTPDPPPLLFPARPWDPSLEAMIDEIAHLEGVDPGLVKAVATVESGWRQWAISHAGAIGIMQVMPGTVWWLETEVFGFDFNEYQSAWDNVRLGARYLRLLLDATGYDYYDTVAAYYQGLTPTEAGVYYADTADYTSMVLSVWDAYWP